jgi:hypothetical protein
VGVRKDWHAPTILSFSAQKAALPSVPTELAAPAWRHGSIVSKGSAAARSCTAALGGAAQVAGAEAVWSEGGQLRWVVRVGRLLHRSRSDGRSTVLNVDDMP